MSGATPTRPPRGWPIEDEQFDHAVGSWPDLRRDAPAGSFMLGWCTGAPGIGLARLSAIELVPQASADVAIAARATVAAGPGRRDHVCCGNLGRAAFLVAAAQQRQDPDLAAAAASVVRFVVDHADSSGDFALVNDAQAQADHLGFFQGTAGIGFQLLRVRLPGPAPVAAAHRVAGLTARYCICRAQPESSPRLYASPAAKWPR